jgi:hypothetical protein
VKALLPEVTDFIKAVHNAGAQQKHEQKIRSVPAWGLFGPNF